MRQVAIRAGVTGRRGVHEARDLTLHEGMSDGLEAARYFDENAGVPGRFGALSGGIELWWPDRAGDFVGELRLRDNGGAGTGGDVRGCVFGHGGGDALVVCSDSKRVGESERGMERDAEAHQVERVTLEDFKGAFAVHTAKTFGNAERELRTFEPGDDVVQSLARPVFDEGFRAGLGHARHPAKRFRVVLANVPVEFGDGTYQAPRDDLSDGGDVLRNPLREQLAVRALECRATGAQYLLGDSIAPAHKTVGGRLSLSPRKCAGASATRQPGNICPSSERGLDETAQLRRARLAKPNPAASSRRTRVSSQPFSPKLSRTAGSAIPAPSSETVTVSGGSPVAAAVSFGWAATVTRTRVASARREFCRTSARISPAVAA